MNPKLRKFVQDTERARSGRMRGLKDLFSRPLTARDWLDSAVVGGATLEDILDGTDADLDPAVVEAFARQYPNAESFTETARGLADDPEALRGLISGVKGKLFEMKYVDYLNGGALPSGYTAALADSPTQAGFDVVVRDGAGNIAQQLQLKASADADYIREAIERYPDFVVVVPTDVFAELAQNPELAGHLIDGGMELSEMEAGVGAAADMASGSGGLDVFPEVAFLFVAASAAVSLARGQETEQVLASAGRRGAKVAVSGAAGGLAAFAIDPFVGLPVSIGASLLMSKAQATKDTAANCEERSVRIKRIEKSLFKSERDGKVRYLPPGRLRLLGD